MKTEKTIWQKSREELFQELSSTPEGLTGAEAARRLEHYGPNELQEGGRKSVLRIFLEQFADFLVIILILAAVVSAILGDVESMAVILAVITMNAILGTVQTVKATASLDSLKQMSAPTAKVVRDGQVVQLPGREVTVGDVVVLEAGDSICADGRLLECASLKCAESALTGESLPVEKDLADIDGDVPLGDRKNMVFSGCFVTYGRARFLVTSTGMHTEMGRIAALLKSTEEKKTPLQVSLDQFGRKLSIGILVICALLFAVSVFLRGENVMNAFLFAVALAVAAIPEALSSIVTIVLSFGTQKMAREHAIIRKLQAVEGLGSVSVICSDKTGTLTQNKMTVKKLCTGGQIIPADGADFSRPEQRELLRAALLCSDATVNESGEVGDPTETALVRLGESYGFDEAEARGKYPRLAELPFDSDRKLMSTVHQLPDGLTMLTKGAVDVMLGRTRLSPEEKAEIERMNEELSQQGLRVLAFGKRMLTAPAIGLEDENDLQFLGLIAMMDPPREESKAAVGECIAAGIRPIMITGDHKVTASAIAKEIGILTPGTEAVEGAVIESMSDEELREFVPRVSVYARVSPEHKIRIVRAWQERGNLVAMTGDGVNDAPALKQADIGVAMGITGTEVAKDAAGMVLTDDLVLNTVFAGFGIGMSLGITLRAGASTGGMDIPPLVLNKWFHLPVSATMMVFDLFIVAVQAAFSPLQQCLYGIVMVIVYTAVLDKVLIFGSTRTEVKIISQHADEIREAIFSQLDRGVTILHGEGGYSRNSEQVLLSVVSNRQLPKLEKIAHLIDPTCFMIVSHVTEVSGRGFSLEKDYKEED